LLKKARTEELTPEESERNRHELIFILKTVPDLCNYFPPAAFFNTADADENFTKESFYRGILKTNSFQS
jgi:hypothetical protein